MISAIVFIINFLMLFFTLRFNNDIILTIESLLLIFLYIYNLKKYKGKYIKFKIIVIDILMVVMQFLILLLLNKYDLITFPNGISGAVNSIYIIMFFYMIDIAYLALILVTNLIKLLIKKIHELDKE